MGNELDENYKKYSEELPACEDFGNLAVNENETPEFVSQVN